MYSIQKNSIMRISLLILCLGSQGISKSFPPSTLDCSKDPSVLGRCMRPLLDIWEQIRTTEIHASHLLFPVPFYSRKSILTLCNAYVESLDECFDGNEGSSCSSSPLLIFLKNHLNFFCGRYAPKILDQYSCISSSLLKSRRCWKSINQVPNPIQNAGKCKGVAEFYECVEGGLVNLCGELAAALFRRSLEEFGCLNESSFSSKILEKANSSGLLTEKYRREYIKRENSENLSMGKISTVEKGGSLFLDNSRKIEIAFINDASEPGIERTDNPDLPRTDKVITTVIENENLAKTSGTTEFIDYQYTTEVTEGISTEITTESATVLPCNVDDNMSITKCFSTLMGNLTGISVISPASTYMLFPLFNVTIKDVTSMCRQYEKAEKCVGNLKDRCGQNQLLIFVNTQFSVICASSSTAEFNQEYQCLQEQILSNKNCLHHINGTLQRNHDRCTEHSAFAECLNDVVTMKCGLGSIALMYKIINGYGCHLQENNSHTIPSTFPTTVSTLREERSEQLLNSIAQMLIISNLHSKQLLIPETRNSVELIDSKLLTQKTIAPISGKKKLNPKLKSENIYVVGFTVGEGSGEEPMQSMEEGSGLEDNYQSKSKAPLLIPDEHLTNKKDSEQTSITQIPPESPIFISSTISPTPVYSLSTELPTSSPISMKKEPLPENSTNVVEHNLKNRPMSFKTEKMQQFDSGEEFNYTISAECTQSLRDKARICVAPLLKTWVALREARSELSQVSFPIYKYTRFELLELCDGYANSFLCAGINDIKTCIMDELVRFAQDHLGYICSPQNIQRFMKHYDCIMQQEVTAKGNCRSYIMGEAIPGKDQYKCRGVKKYRLCLSPLVRKHCSAAAVDEFDRSIQQFGCLIH